MANQNANEEYSTIFPDFSWDSRNKSKYINLDGKLITSKIPNSSASGGCLGTISLDEGIFVWEVEIIRPNTLVGVCECGIDFELGFTGTNATKTWSYYDTGGKLLPYQHKKSGNIKVLKGDHIGVFLDCRSSKTVVLSFFINGKIQGSSISFTKKNKLYPYACVAQHASLKLKNGKNMKYYKSYFDYLTKIELL